MKDKSQPSQNITQGSGTLKDSVRSNNASRGFAKVVAGGRIVRLRKEVPFYERLVTGESSIPTSKEIQS